MVTALHGIDEYFALLEGEIESMGSIGIDVVYDDAVDLLPEVLDGNCIG